MSEVPDPLPDSVEREFILRDCADRLANLGDAVTVDQMAAIMIDRLTKDASGKIMRFCKLGKVLDDLNESLAGQMPKGMYGFGKVFRGAFERVGEATGSRGSDPQIEKATDDLLDKFLETLYRLAEVER